MLQQAVDAREEECASVAVARAVVARERGVDLRPRSDEAVFGPRLFDQFAEADEAIPVLALGSYPPVFLVARSVVVVRFPSGPAILVAQLLQFVQQRVEALQQSTRLLKQWRRFRWELIVPRQQPRQ
jgi:hypothetical protein